MSTEADILSPLVVLCLQEQKGLVNMLDQQHQTEENEETYRLKLEQDEETEKLRKVQSDKPAVKDTSIQRYPVNNG